MFLGSRTALVLADGEAIMQPRIDYRKHSQDALKSVLSLEKYIAESGLEPKLVHLIKMRASQINGCAYCLDLPKPDFETCPWRKRGHLGANQTQPNSPQSGFDRKAAKAPPIRESWTLACRENGKCRLAGGGLSLERTLLRAKTGNFSGKCGHSVSYFGRKAAPRAGSHRYSSFRAP